MAGRSEQLSCGYVWDRTFIWLHPIRGKVAFLRFTGPQVNRSGQVVKP